MIQGTMFPWLDKELQSCPVSYRFFTIVLWVSPSNFASAMVDKHCPSDVWMFQSSYSSYVMVAKFEIARVGSIRFLSILHSLAASFRHHSNQITNPQKLGKILIVHTKYDCCYTNMLHKLGWISFSLVWRPKYESNPSKSSQTKQPSL